MGPGSSLCLGHLIVSLGPVLQPSHSAASVPCCRVEILEMLRVLSLDTSEPVLVCGLTTFERGRWKQGPILRFHKPLYGFVVFLRFCSEAGPKAPLPKLTPALLSLALE